MIDRTKTRMRIRKYGNDGISFFQIVKSARDIVEAVESLIQRANENGGSDNIGVVLAQPYADEVSVW